VSDGPAGTVGGGRGRSRFLPLLLVPVALLTDLAAALPLQTYYFRDFSVTFYPLRAFATRELSEGRLPFWNPYIFEGSFAVPALYPPELLHALAPGPLLVSWLLTLHLPLAALAAFWLARELGAGRAGAFTAGVAYALGGLALSSLNLYVFLQALALAPFVVGFLRRAAAGSGREVAAAAVTVALALSTLAVEFVGQALLLGLLLALRLMSPQGFGTALPKVGVFAMALVQLLPAVTNLGRMRMELLGAVPEAESVYHELTGPMPRRKDGTEALTSFEKSIDLENVSYGYEDRQILFDDLNLTIEKGKVTAIVGPSGVGKTTLINLILGLYEATGGRILIDGVSLQEFKVDTWLSRIGFVSQDPFIYHATVADNIIFGRNGHSMHRVVEAAKIANAHGFISELPEGYETVVGERGMKLSGGQQQRVAIARALLDDPEILILDEATSSLDSISEKLVQEAIENASRDRTVLIIAHRLSTVRYADKIIVLDAGRVVEEGSHQELIGRQGHYARLVTSFKDS